MLETIVNLHDFYSLNLWKILSGGLGWSSHTVSYLTITDVTSYVQFLSCCTSQPKNLNNIIMLLSQKSNSCTLCVPMFIRKLNLASGSLAAAAINYRLFALSRSVFCVVLFCSPSRSFFRLNHLRKVRKRCSHSVFSSPAIILALLTETSAGVMLVFYGCYERPLRPFLREQGQVGSQIKFLLTLLTCSISPQETRTLNQR